MCQYVGKNVAASGPLSPAHYRHTTQMGEPISGLSRSCKSLLLNHFLNRDGRIELRASSAPSARLAKHVRIYRRRPDARLEPATP